MSHCNTPICSRDYGCKCICRHCLAELDAVDVERETVAAITAWLREHRPEYPAIANAVEAGAWKRGKERGDG